MNLHGHIHHAFGHLCSEELGHGCVFGNPFDTAVLQPRGMIDQHPGRLYLCGHIRQHVAYALVPEDGLAESDSLLRILESGVEGRLRYPHPLRAHGGAVDVQVVHGYFEPLALLAKKVSAGDAAVLINQLADGVRRHKVQTFTILEARRPLLQDEGGESPVTRFGIGLGEGNVGVRIWGVGNKALLPVQNVEVPFQPGRGLRPCHV